MSVTSTAGWDTRTPVQDRRQPWLAAGLAIAGLGFVLYPAIRPFSDEVSLDGAAAFASPAWVVAHSIAIVSFVLLALGLYAVSLRLQGTAGGRRARGAVVLGWLGVGLTLPYYGAEVFGLHAAGRAALDRGDTELLDTLTQAIRWQAGIWFIVAGSAPARRGRCRRRDGGVARARPGGALGRRASRRRPRAVPAAVHRLAGVAGRARCADGGGLRVARHGRPADGGGRRAGAEAMTAATAWLRVALAVAVYLVAAVGASMLIKRVGADHKDMAARTGRAVALIGLVTNLLVLGLVLLMVSFVDGRPLGDLGLGVDARDVVVIAVSLVVIAALAAMYLLRLRAGGTSDVSRRRADPGSAPDLTGGLLVVLVLVAVALQEEVLFRGYVALNLLQSGWVVVAVTSTVVFAAIHLVTNRADAAQVTSWLVGGALFSLAYLVSGSLWVAIVLHLAADLTNVVAFGIVGRYTPWTIDPAPSGAWRASYRAVSSAAIALVVLVGYGVQVNPALEATLAASAR